MSARRRLLVAAWLLALTGCESAVVLKETDSATKGSEQHVATFHTLSGAEVELFTVCNGPDRLYVAAKYDGVSVAVVSGGCAK